MARKRRGTMQRRKPVRRTVALLAVVALFFDCSIRTAHRQLAAMLEAGVIPAASRLLRTR